MPCQGVHREQPSTPYKANEEEAGSGVSLLRRDVFTWFSFHPLAALTYVLVCSSALQCSFSVSEGKHAYMYSLYYSHRFLQQFCEIIVNSSNWLLHFKQCFYWRFLHSKLLINSARSRRPMTSETATLLDTRLGGFHAHCQRFTLSNPAGTWRVGRGWCWSTSEFHGLMRVRSSQIAFKIALQRVYFRFQTGTWKHHALSKDKK